MDDMQFPTNRPIVLATSATTFNDITVTASPDPDTTPGPNTGNLTVNDAASLAAANSGNVLFSMPFAALFNYALYRGRIAGSGATSSGLVVSGVPGGVACIVRFGE
jgi:hypothetical protein